MDVIVHKIHQLTSSIRAFELISLDGSTLPSFEAGAHIDVHLKNGLTRQYSLSNNCNETHRYVIGVLNDDHSRGGSRCIHTQYNEGDQISIGVPRNLFHIHPETKAALLFAGGIGITPILSMAYQFSAQHIPFELHYFVRSHEMIAFYGNLTEHFAPYIHFHIQDQPDTLCDMNNVLKQPSPDKHLYVCGPTGFMDYVMNSAQQMNWQSTQLHQEHFAAQKVDCSNDSTFTIEIKGHDTCIQVSPEQTVSQALLEHGFNIPISCEQGICGTCITRVVSGIPDHRDMYLTEEEHALNHYFTPCCSRAKSEKLVIEI